MSILDELKFIKQNINKCTFGTILRSTRDVLGMKQWKLAEILGVAISVIKLYETDNYRSAATDDAVVRFCKAFEYDISTVRSIVLNQHEKYKDKLQFVNRHPRYTDKIKAVREKKPIFEVDAVTGIDRNSV